MSWESTIRSVMGECSELENTDLANTTFNVINNFPQANNDNNQLSWTKPSKLLLWTDIVNNSTITLFGLPLKTLDDEETNKVLCCRAYFYNKDDNGKILFNTCGWSIYDRETLSYTDITVWTGGTGGGGANCLDHTATILFRAQMETFQGVEQLVLYGGCGHTMMYSGADLFAMLLQGLPLTTYLSQYKVVADEIEFSPEYGEASQPGGYEGGSFDDTSDTIGIDAKPSIGVSTAGFINVYKVGANDLQNLGEKLFPHIHAPEFLDDPNNLSIPEMLSTIVTMMYGAVLFPVGTSAKLLNDIGVIDVLMNGKLIDYVIDCHIIPCSISGATVEGLRVGYRQFNDIQLARATEDYVDVDCGSLSIREYFANFLDFASCECQLWLPFVGYVPVDNEYWNGGTIQVKYRFNIIDGSFQAFVISTSGKSNLSNTIIAQYGGVACVHYPITGIQYANVISGLVNGTAGAIASGKGGNAAGVATNLMNMAMLRPENPSSNGYSASSSFLSKRTPYLIIKRGTPQFSKSYPKERGLPLNVTRTLSSVHGFTQIDNPVLNIDCNDREYDELVQLLKTGIIL